MGVEALEVQGARRADVLVIQYPFHCAKFSLLLGVTPRGVRIRVAFHGTFSNYLDFIEYVSQLPQRTLIRQDYLCDMVLCQSKTMRVECANHYAVPKSPAQLRKMKSFYTFAFKVQALSKHAHRLNKNANRLSARMAQKNPTIACGPTFSTSSPLIGMQTSVAKLAMK